MFGCHKPYCKEYGVSMLVTQLFVNHIQTLAQFFPDHIKQIIAIAYFRFIFRCPLKNIPFRLAQSFLPELLGLTKFNDKSSSFILKTIGGMHDQMLGYMKSFIAWDEYLLMDLTHVFSKSRLMTISRKGYNNQMNFDPQFNL